MSLRSGMIPAPAAGLWRRSWLLTAAMFSPVLLCLAIMLPRLLEARFALFDDAETLEVARSIVTGNWETPEASQGRFRPTYWLYFAATYAVAGADPFGFFAGNALVFAGITGSLIALVRLRGGNRFQAWAAGCLLVLSGPTIESFYTLSKAEPPQVLLLLLSLLSMALAERLNSGIRRTLAMVLGGLLVLMAMGCKETSLVIIPISIIWYVTNSRSGKRSEHARALRAYAVACLVAGCFYFTLRLTFATASPASGTYSDEFVVSMERMAVSSVRWAGWLLRDFSHQIVVLVPLAYWLATRRQIEGSSMLAGSAVWMASWVLVFLPWPYALEYYALPFAVGASAFSGVILGEALAVRSVRKLSERVGVGACLALVLISVTASGANNMTSARLQLSVDAADGEMIDYLAEHVPPGGIVTVNLPGESEYVKKVGPLLLQWKARGDIRVSAFSFQTATEMPRSMTSYLVVAPYVINQPPLSIRLGVDEVGCRRWNEALSGFLGKGVPPVASIGRQFALSNVEFIRLLCTLVPFGHYCSTSGPLIDTRPLAYGWDIYEVNLDHWSTVTPAVFRPDGKWELQRTDGSVVEVSLGEPEDVPVVGDWDGDGWSNLGVFRNADQAWYLDTDFDGEAEISLRFVGMGIGDIPFAGDWDGDGVYSPGFYRPEDTTWHFRNSLSTGAEELPVIKGGSPSDTPVAGDWNGDGIDTIGVYRPLDGEVDLEDGLVLAASGADFFVPPNAVPVVGDWGGQGLDTLAFVVDGVWYRQLTNCDCLPSNEPRAFTFGSSAGVPLAGAWPLGQ